MYSSHFTVAEIFTDKEALVWFETALIFAALSSPADANAGISWNSALANMAVIRQEGDGFETSTMIGENGE